GRRDPRAVPVRAQSRLARLLRPGSDHGGGNPPQGLRHAGGGKDAAAGFPLSIPVARLCREERIGLPRNPGALESDDLNAATASPRLLPLLSWLLWRGARVRLTDAGPASIAAAHEDDHTPRIVAPSPRSRGTGARSRVIITRAAGLGSAAHLLSTPRAMTELRPP